MFSSAPLFCFDGGTAFARNFIGTPGASDPVAIGSGTQGDAAMRSDIARTTFGVDGTGIKVGILSDSFNRLGGMASDIASGQLPTSVTILKDYTASGYDEGRAMAQVVHDVAPGSSIAFYTAYAGEADFAAGITALFNAGCRVIVDDITYFHEPFFQSNAICSAIDSVVSQGAVYFTSAGNDANNSYQSSFRPTSIALPDGVRANVHDFDPGAGVSGLQSITIGANHSATMVIQWDQPYGAASDMQARFYSGSSLLATFDSTGTPDPIIALTATAGSTPLTFQVAIDSLSGALPSTLKYVLYGDGAPVSINTFSSPAGTVTGHHMDPNAFAVGASYWGSPTSLEWFSSYGDAQYYFDASGNRLSSPLSLNKVDFVAPDGITTTVPAMSSFYGTSAAAPDAAAVAALMLQARGTLTAQDVGNLLKDSALDMGAAGYDNATGYGFIQADKAVGFASTLNITGSTGADWLVGTHLGDRVDGGIGNDTLDGASGADTMLGSAGNDSYYVDSAGDVVTENAGEGLDRVYASRDYTLPANVEYLYLVGAGTWNGTGNSLDNNMYGNVWNNYLDGGTGGDYMAGGRGDDAYFVDSNHDVVDEKPGEGGDTVDTYISYELPKTSEVENLVLLPAGGAINGVGSDTNNLIQGNDFDNIIIGQKGDDYLDGRGGADRYVFQTGDGHDTIVGYNNGEGDFLDIRVSGYTTASQILAAARDNGTSTTITFNAQDSITLVGVHANQLSSADFMIYIV